VVASRTRVNTTQAYNYLRASLTNLHYLLEITTCIQVNIRQSIMRRAAAAHVLQSWSWNLKPLDLIVYIEECLGRRHLCLCLLGDSAAPPIPCLSPLNLSSRCNFLLMEEFQWFFTALSVLPGNNLAICAQ